MKGAGRTLESYSALFQEARPEHLAIGEASTTYLATPRSAQAIHRHCPDIKLVAILRHPAERAYSSYQMYVRHDLESLSFPAAVAAELHAMRTGEKTSRKYIRLGFYGLQLQAYLKTFRRDQLRLYIHRDYHTNPRNVLHDIFDFIGVQTQAHINTRVRHNVSRPASAAPPEVALPDPRFWKTVIRHLVPPGVRQALRRRMARPHAPKIGFPPETRRQLIELYEQDIRLVEQLTNRDLSFWRD